MYFHIFSYIQQNKSVQFPFLACFIFGNVKLLSNIANSFLAFCEFAKQFHISVPLVYSICIPFEEANEIYFRSNYSQLFFVTAVQKLNCCTQTLLEACLFHTFSKVESTSMGLWKQPFVDFCNLVSMRIYHFIHMFSSGHP